MWTQSAYDAIVVGSGPNGLAAAIKIAMEGRSVLVVEAMNTIGGGCRTKELTLEGHLHDVCSAVQPLAVGSPFLKNLPLEKHGLEWLFPPLSLAHPLDGGRAAAMYRSVGTTAGGFGPDAERYRRLMGPLVDRADALFHEFLGPLRPPRHPTALVRFGLKALQPAPFLMRSFETDEPRAMFAGCAAHSMLPLTKVPAGAFGLMIALTGHAVGWPVARGGSQSIADAMAAHLRSLGGEIVTSHMVTSLDELPRARAYLLDVTPKQVLGIAGNRLPPRYRKALGRYRYGEGIFKLDLVLDGPIPWAAEACRRAGTVHLGGTLEEVVSSEGEVADGRHSQNPFVLVAQPSLMDETRAPEGRHIIWAYCHVPGGSTLDMTGRIEAQLERFAPGFKDRVLARSTMNSAELEAHNPNYVGGDINGGIQDLFQTFTRPVARLSPYTTPNRQIYICSSSTPPGGGVHGMCGFHAARSALTRALA